MNITIKRENKEKKITIKRKKIEIPSVGSKIIENYYLN